MTQFRIRRANFNDTASLTDLAMRSKGYWDYDVSFMSDVVPLLDFSAVDITLAQIYVIDDDVSMLGFYQLTMINDRPYLDHLWIDPPYVRTGLGKHLWLHALSTARSLGWDHLLIESDPNAEDFYLKMGARRIGEQRSGMGRLLPLLYLQLPR